MRFGFALCSVVVAGMAVPTFAEDAPMSQGEYLARLGNCVACHTVEGGAPFAGGLKMKVPMLGHIYTTNITPDPETGIGDYTLEDFDAAMREGVAKDGHNLYPAMPYPSYAKMTEEDIAALYDYFMNEVEPVRQPNLPNEIEGLKSARWPVSIWNMLHLDDDAYEPDQERSEQWNRGAYLVQGLGHCGACHTPRGMMLQEKGLDESSSDFLAGAELDHWYASSLKGEVNSGLGRWTEDDLVEYMKTGKNRFGKAVGTMVEVVNNSTSHMSDDDLKAMAVYLKSLRAGNEPYPEYQYDSSTEAKLAQLDFSDTGAKVYYQSCIHCHSADGSGQSTYIPPLAGNPAVMDPAPSSLINVTLNGSLRVVSHGQPEPYDMPGYRLLLDKQEVADVITFIRNSWGNKGSAISVAEVEEVYKATDLEANDVVILQMK